MDAAVWRWGNLVGDMGPVAWGRRLPSRSRARLFSLKARHGERRDVGDVLIDERAGLGARMVVGIQRGGRDIKTPTVT